MSDAALRGLQGKIGYSFKDEDLLVRAMTHSSAEAQSAGLINNERLEFLGDRVLGLQVASSLLKLYPDAEEGELAPRLNNAVRKETLAEIALEIGLGPCLVLAEGEDRSGGRKKPALLADAMEALIAAIYLDGGMQAASKFISTYWKDRLVAVRTVPRDAKTALQEWSQGQGSGTPIYTLVSQTGPDHAPEFILEVRVEGRKSRRGTGASKRDAEQAAAQALLEAEGVET